jgi:hypothetical protein
MIFYYRADFILAIIDKYVSRIFYLIFRWQIFVPYFFAFMNDK